MNGVLLVLTVESGLHAGAGESIGTIDMPIQRNVATRYPQVHGQSLKGAARRLYRDHARNKPSLANGSEFAEEDVFGSIENGTGWLSVGDAVLAAFPVPSTKNCFAWVTSPLALEEVRRRVILCGLPPTALPPSPLTDEDAFVGTGGWVGQVDLGDFRVKTTLDENVKDWATWLSNCLPTQLSHCKTKMATDLVVVSDALLADLTIEFTEVSARIQLETEQKTVANGPFYCEYLPSNTVLVSRLGVASPSKERQDALKGVYDDKCWQIGGDESIGKGLVWSTIMDGSERTDG